MIGQTFKVIGEGLANNRLLDMKLTRNMWHSHSEKTDGKKGRFRNIMDELTHYVDDLPEACEKSFKIITTTGK